MKRNKAWAWIRWFLFSEGLILLLALAGPGDRYWRSTRDNYDLLAQIIVEDPSYMEAVVVNFVVVNLFVVCAFLAAWAVTRLRRKE